MQTTWMFSKERLLLHFNVSKQTRLQCHSWLCTLQCSSSIGICCTLWSIFHVQKSLELLHLSWQCLYQLVCCCIVLQAPFDGLAKQPCLMIEDIKTPFSFCVAEWELYWMNQLVYSADSEHWVSITVAFWQTFKTSLLRLWTEHLFYAFWNLNIKSCDKGTCHLDKASVSLMIQKLAQYQF